MSLARALQSQLHVLDGMVAVSIVLVTNTDLLAWRVLLLLFLPGCVHNPDLR